MTRDKKQNSHLLVKDKTSLFVWYNSDTRKLNVLYRSIKITLKYIKNKLEDIKNTKH